MRYSRQRELILKVLSETDSHPTAQEIYDVARKREPRISLGTVYRNLREMSDRNEIRVVKTGDAEVHYDARMSGHCHFKCRSCGRVIDVFEQPEGRETVAGHRVESVDVVYFGTCAECLGKSGGMD